MTKFVKKIDDPKYYFDLACAEHARVNLFFTLDMCHISNIAATCVMVKNGHFVASAPIEEIEHQPIVWGTETEGYFAVRDVDLVHCHFRSRLGRLYNGPDHSMFLIFPLPEKIDHKQRRFSLRLPLDRDSAGKFQVWLAETVEAEGKLPALRWQSLTPPLCTLGNISANGLRLDLAASHPLAEAIDINDPVLLRGDFGLPGKPLPLSVLALARRKMTDSRDEKLLHVGCQFLKWRKLEGAHAHSWFKAESDVGIAAIAQWVARNFRPDRQ